MSVENELLRIRFYRPSRIRSRTQDLSPAVSCAAGEPQSCFVLKATRSLQREMYRGRPPPRGGYLPPFQGRESRAYPAPGYRDDRSRSRPPYHHDYHDHGHTDTYSRSPPRKRYPSPGSGSHRRGEPWAGDLPRQVSEPGSIPDQHQNNNQRLIVVMRLRLRCAMLGYLGWVICPLVAPLSR